MTDDKFDPDESHFRREEFEAALAGFEKELRTIRYPAMPVIPVMPIKQRTLLQRSPDSDANDDTADKASADSGQPMTDDVTGSVADAVNEAMADVIDPRSASTTNSLDCWVTRRRWR